MSDTTAEVSALTLAAVCELRLAQRDRAQDPLSLRFREELDQRRRVEVGPDGVEAV